MGKTHYYRCAQRQFSTICLQPKKINFLIIFNNFFIIFLGCQTDHTYNVGLDVILTEFMLIIYYQQLSCFNLLEGRLINVQVGRVVGVKKTEIGHSSTTLNNEETLVPILLKLRENS